ncbi:Tas retrotransposon peptidase A16, partial [Ostertagia ostertagi]
AVKQLHDQFHNEELNVKLLLEQLDKIPQSSENASQLRATLNDVMAIIAPLSRFEGHIDALEYKAKVRRKFPPSIQRKLLSKEYDDSNMWSMDTLISETPSTPQTTILHTQASATVQYSCAACSGSHKLRYCNRYRSVDSKRQRIQDLNKCFKCFSTTHYRSQCAKAPCRYCGGQHNISLCRKTRSESPSPYRNRNPSNAQHSSRERSTSRSNRERSASKSSQSPLRRNSSSRSNSRSRQRSVPDSSKSSRAHPRCQTPHPRSPTMVNTAMSDIEDNVISGDEEVVFIHRTDVSSSESSSRLMVIPVTVYNPSNQLKESVYALIDTGSTRSFISCSLAKRLDLPSSSSSSYILTTFGGKQEKRKSRKCSACLVDLRGEEIHMNLLSVDVISHTIILPRLSLSDISHAHQYLSNESLLNEADIEVSPDILIGIDYYNNIMNVTETPLQLPSGLQAIPTIFGHVVTGKCSELDQTSHHCFMTALPEHESLPDISL